MRSRLALTLVLLAVEIAATARARADGFQLDRYEPAAAGSWFFGVEHPWYSSTRRLAAGLTLDYGHNPLLGGEYEADGFERKVSIIEHEFVGHLDVAGSFLDRVQVQASLPIVLLQRGTPGYGVAPMSGAAVGDPRLGGLVRIYGQPDRDAFSLHGGFYLWIPVGAEAKLVGDPGVRGMPQVVAAGLIREHLRWALSTGFLFRGVTRLGFGPASSIGSELQVRAGVGWGDTARRYNVGPELSLTTPITGDNAFASKATGLELLLGGQYNVARQVQLGTAVGLGVAPTLGTPDVRVLFRAAWAPQAQVAKARDADNDGVPDAEDLCPNQMGSRAAQGCPDADEDGVPDAEDLCPKQMAGKTPDPGSKGCPKDSDSDGVPDAEDLCPDQAAGAMPDPRGTGCPRDSDSDGVPDAEDLCPADAAGSAPDRRSKGCPLKDGDGDGVPDVDDKCPKLAAGASPDPRRTGCPLPDGDGDGVPDSKDACPKLAGVPDADRRINGCPRLEQAGWLSELKSVHFDTNKATLLPVSFPILDELAKLLGEHREVRTLLIEGHADDTGTHEWNMKLSHRRADAVVRYLIKHGIGARRLRAVGFGDTRPLSPDRTDEARARNRRVEMRVPKDK